MRPQFRDFGTNEELLEFIKEVSYAIDKIVIHPPGSCITRNGKPVSQEVDDFMIVIHYNDGTGHSIIGPESAELLINDGVLVSMKIPVNFQKL